MIDKTKEFEASYLKSLNEKWDDSLKPFEIKSIEEELKVMEEKFRDPNLLIESIREMQRKQQEAIETIQLKLNEMNSIKKDYLKESNEFISIISISFKPINNISN